MGNPSPNLDSRLLPDQAKDPIARSESPSEMTYLWLKRLAVYSVPLFIALTLLLTVLNVPLGAESPDLLLLLNIIFLSATGLVIAAVAARTYLASGLQELLWMGTGLLAYGAASLLAGPLLGLDAGPNKTITVHNTGVLLGGLFHFTGAFLIHSRGLAPDSPRTRGRNLLLTYLSVTAFVFVLTFASIEGKTPLFFEPGVGSTVLRQIVLGSAVVLYLVSYHLLRQPAAETKNDFFFWYSQALVLIAVGLVALLFQTTTGSLLNWTGRAAQYVAGSFFALAILVALRRGHAQGLALEFEIADFFQGARANYQALVESATDAIIGLNTRGDVLLWNPAAERIFGYTYAEAVGARLTNLILSADAGEAIRKEWEDYFQSGANVSGKTSELVARRKGGEHFPIEYTLSTRRIGNLWTRTLILRDVTARKQAETRLQEAMHTAQENEQRYRSLFDGMTEGFALHEIICDDQGKPIDYRFLEINPAFERLTGLRSDAVIGKRVSEVLPNNEPYWVETYGVVALTGKPVRFDNYSAPLRRHYEVYAYSPAPRQFAVLFTDITERKRIEEEIRRSRALLQAVVEGTSDPIFVKDSNGRYLLMNTAGARVLGKTPEQVLGKDDTTLFPAAEAARLMRVDHQVLESGKIATYEETVTASNGVPVVFSLTKGPLVDERGQVAGLFGIARDITARTQVEEHIRKLNQTLEQQSEELSTMNIQLEQALTQEQAARVQAEEARQILESLMQYAPEGIIIADAPSGKARMRSRYAEEMTGLSAGQVPSPLSQDPFTRMDLLNPDGTPVALADVPLVRALQQGEVVSDKELLFRRSGDTSLPVLCSAAPIRDRVGNITGGIVLIRDITIRKGIEKQVEKLHHDLEQRAVELEVANKELESFSYSVSHDLRTPLASIHGFATLVLEDYASQLTPDGRRFVELIQNNAAEANQLVEGLLSFSRFTRQPIRKQPVDLDQLTRQVLDDLKGQQRGRHVETIIGPLPPVQADPLLLKQVLTNLLSNALKFTRQRDPARIEINCMTDASGEVVFFVRDNGVGFDNAQAEKLFGVFQRLHHQEDFEGTGVGLAIVERIIHRHGGRVCAEGEVDRGATFYFTLG